MTPGSGGATPARHGDDAGEAFPFSRIVPRDRAGRQLTPAALRAIAASMTSCDEPIESEVPAGYTYLGQFIAHDLSFDDDSLYGRGPRLDPQYYAHDGVHLLTGGHAPGRGRRVRRRVARGPSTSPARATGRPSSPTRATSG